MNKGPVSQFIQHHFRHFNAAALMDAAKGYEQHLLEGGKMMVTLAGAMSTAELGISLAEMIRQGKVDIISCTGANLEEGSPARVAAQLSDLLPGFDAGAQAGNRIHPPQPAEVSLNPEIGRVRGLGREQRDRVLDLGFQFPAHHDSPADFIVRCVLRVDAMACDLRWIQRRQR